jgi:hypothetical protein
VESHHGRAEWDDIAVVGVGGLASGKLWWCRGVTFERAEARRRRRRGDCTSEGGEPGGLTTGTLNTGNVSDKWTCEEGLGVDPPAVDTLCTRSSESVASCAVQKE